MGTFWEDLGKRFGETAETVTNKAGEVVTIQKLKNQIRALERGNESDFIDLGRMVYEQFKKGEAMSDEAAGLCEAIQSREESICEYEKEISDVKGDFECESCGKTVAKGMAYCPFCGEKTPQDLEEEVDYASELKEKAADMADKAEDAAEKIFEKAEDLVDKAEDFADKAVQTVGDAAEKAADKLKEKTTDDENR